MTDATRKSVVILSLASSVIFLKSLFNGHTMDDHPAIEWNAVVLGKKEGVSLLDGLLTTDFWGQQLDLVRIASSSPQSHFQIFCHCISIAV